MCQSNKTPRGGSASNTKTNKPPFTHAGENKDSKPVRTVQNETSTKTDEYPLHNVDSPAATKPLLIEVIINNQSISMEVDTGSAVTLVSEHTFKNKWPDTYSLTDLIS